MGGTISFHPLKKGGGGAQNVLPCLGGGGVQQVSDMKIYFEYELKKYCVYCILRYFLSNLFNLACN